jgi:hypothetical protein
MSLRGFAGVVTCVLAAAPSLAGASEIDPATGAFHYASDAVRVWHFDSADELTAPGAAYLLGTPSAPVDATGLLPFFVATDPALEGKGALHLSPGSQTSSGALLLSDSAAFAKVAGSRIEVTAWTRAEGMLPAIEIEYAQPDWIAADPNRAFGFAQVRLQRTGRATSDGWFELTSGPIDGNVWGAPVAFIALFPSSFGRNADYTLVDGLELRTVPGALTPDTTCTLADRDQRCGSQGDCLFGQCVPASVVWGSLPPAEHRRSLAERWIQLGARLIGDRHAQSIGRAGFTTTLRGLESEDGSPRRFFEGLHTAVLSLRDSHTNLGQPPSEGTFFNPGTGQHSGSLDACFGVVESDVLGGGRGYGVFATGPGTVLKPGDIVQSIDGQAPDEWLGDALSRFGAYMPADPRADPSVAGVDLAALVSTRAKTLTVVRCSSATACTGADRKLVTVDVPALVADGLRQSGTVPGWAQYGCSPRFNDAVSTLASSTTGDAVSVELDKVGNTEIQFDGFTSDQAWLGNFQAAFGSSPANVLVDARQGNGGQLSAMLFLGDLLRSTSQPIVLLTAPAASWLLPDTPQLFTPRCTVSSATMSFVDLACQGGDSAAFVPSSATAPGATSRIAWINTFDVSANDLIARWIQGREGVRIFSPVPTFGALGAIQSGETALYGWSGGPTLQVEDSRVAALVDGLSTARWESGHGIDPDENLAQKVSDIFAGKDTLLERARAWLAEKP